jgi:hypothetical protein
MAIPPLNDKLLWRQVPAADRSSFRHGQAQKVLLPSGYALFKFSQWDLVKPDGTVTPWWFSVTPHWPQELGMDRLVRRAANVGATPAEYARAVAAVNRNAMTQLLRARLCVAAHGFVGPCSGQPLDPDRPEWANVVLLGGVVQLYIPNLRKAHVRAL